MAYRTEFEKALDEACDLVRDREISAMVVVYVTTDPRGDPVALTVGSAGEVAKLVKVLAAQTLGGVH